MALTERLAILITANGAQAMAEFQKTGRTAERSMRTLDGRTQQIGAGLTRAGAAMVGFGAVTALGMFKAAQAAEEQRLAVISLQNALSNSPVITNASTAAFEAQAEALQQVTVAGDEEIVSAQARLATFRVTRDEIQGLTPLIVDYARKYGVDLVSAANNVGKAMMGNVGALQRQGVFIDENVYATDRYTAVMQALRENAGGFAEAEGATFTGQLEIMKNRLGEVAEGVGVGAVDAFSNLLGAVEGVSAAFGSTSAGSQAFVGQLLTYGAIGVTASGALSLIAGGLVRFAGQAKAAADAAYMLYLRVRTSNITMGQIAGGAGVAAGALALIAAGYSTVKGTAAGFQANQRAIADAMSQSASAAGQLRGSLDNLEGTDWQAGGDEIRQAMEAAGISTEEAAEAIREGGAALDELNRKLLETGEVSDKTLSAWEQVVFDPFGAGGESVQEDADRLTASLQVLNEQMNATDANNAAEAAVEGLGNAAAGTEEALQELSQAIDDYLNGITGVSGAQDDLEQSFNTFFESLTANGPVFEGMTAGAMANREAFSGLLADQGALIQSMLDTGASTEEMSNALWQSVGRLNQTRQAGLITEQQFDFLAQSILGIPISSETTVTAPGLSFAEYQAREFERAMNRLNGRHIAVYVDAQLSAAASNALRAFASGTPSAPQGLALVGEDGPELVDLNGGERIYPAGETRSLLGAGRPSVAAGSSGGGGVVVHIHGDVYDADRLADKIGDALRRRERAVAA